MLAAILVGLGVGTRFVLGLPAGSFPFTTFYMPIAIAAWIGGLRAGMLATFLAAFIGWYIFLLPVWDLRFQSYDEVEAIIIFIVTGLFISSVVKQAQIAGPPPVPEEVLWK